MKALILVDVQNDFVTGPLGTKEAQAAIPNIKKLIKDMTDEAGGQETACLPLRLQYPRLGDCQRGRRHD